MQKFTVSIIRIEADLAEARSRAEAASEIPFFGSREMRESAWRDLVEADKRVDALEAELERARAALAAAEADYRNT